MSRLQGRIAANPDGSVIGDAGTAILNYKDGKIDVTSKSLSGKVANDHLFLSIHGNSFGDPENPVNAEINGASIVLRAPGQAQKLNRSPQLGGRCIQTGEAISILLVSSEAKCPIRN